MISNTCRYYVFVCIFVYIHLENLLSSKWIEDSLYCSQYHNNNFALFWTNSDENVSFVQNCKITLCLTMDNRTDSSRHTLRVLAPSSSRFFHAEEGKLGSSPITGFIVNVLSYDKFGCHFPCLIHWNLRKHLNQVEISLKS